MGHITHFFLGANSADGFYSLYREIAENPALYVYFLKGGPGGGKSTFLRAIGDRAQALGQDVEYLLCSGDPDSLDGVILPELGKAWLDATAPHALEPAPYGVQGEYLHLGQFCRTAEMPRSAEEIQRLDEAYRQQYRYAYAYLAAAGELKRAAISDCRGSFTAQLVRKRAESKFNRLSARSCPAERESQRVKRFLRAVSCQGEYCCPGTLDALCDQLCVCESQYGLEQIYFRELLRLSTDAGLSAVQCLHPLCPELTEAVLYPDLQFGVITPEALPEFSGILRTVHLDTYLTAADKKARRHLEKQLTGLTESACIHLQKGKVIHDQLEALYRPALDLPALADFTKQYIGELFP